MNEVELRTLSTNDLYAVADVHLAAFPDSALSKLGRSAVRRYYEWQLTGPHEYDAAGAFVDGELCGFCFGGVARGALSGFLRRNWRFLIGSILLRPWLLAKDEIRERINEALRSLRRRSRSEKSTSTNRNAARRRSFGILAIAVNPDRQGCGIGRRLMERAEQSARNGGFSMMHLTVHPENAQAVRFYERQDWRRDGVGDWLGRMIKPLS